jgi:hypothetical protein
VEFKEKDLSKKEKIKEKVIKKVALKEINQ